MNFSTFFSMQARKPSGIFGKIVMSFVFDKGNSFLNGFTNEVMSIRPDERILDIGCGTGKLVKVMSDQITSGQIDGIDFSGAMVSIARKRNKKNISTGKVKILEGDFNTLSFPNNFYDKICTVNTLYFWSEPMATAQKAADILKPGGKFVVAFEDIEQLEKRNLNRDVFSFYKADDVKNLLAESGFSGDSGTVSRTKGIRKFHCVVAEKQ